MLPDAARVPQSCLRCGRRAAESRCTSLTFLWHRSNPLVHEIGSAGNTRKNASMKSRTNVNQPELVKRRIGGPTAAEAETRSYLPERSTSPPALVNSLLRAPLAKSGIATGVRPLSPTSPRWREPRTPLRTRSSSDPGRFKRLRSARHPQVIATPPPDIARLLDPHTALENDPAIQPADRYGVLTQAVMLRSL